ncbi:MAG: hypothetical protein KGD67_08875 [Candidatus Lokiarchaeota archaeon]|nr:hypothetical protein [Candidatus Lokiarchaeota archaeon]
MNKNGSYCYSSPGIRSVDSNNNTVSRNIPNNNSRGIYL